MVIVVACNQISELSECLFRKAGKRTLNVIEIPDQYKEREAMRK